MSTAHNEDYRILIRSVSEQFEHTEPLPAEETDKIELMTYGSFLKKAGSYYISYKETETIGFAGCTTTIKIAEDGSRVALLRFGRANSQLLIERDRRNLCHYETEVGSLTLGVTGDGIDCKLTEKGGSAASRATSRSLRAARQSSAICWMPMTPRRSSIGQRLRSRSSTSTEHPHPLRHRLRDATSPKVGGLDSLWEVSDYVKSSPFGRAGREAA